MSSSSAFILVGDHLGQVKKVVLPSGEVSLLGGCTTPSRQNPIVSIEPCGQKGYKQLIANKNGELCIYDCVLDTVTKSQTVEGDLNKALPISEENALLIYDRRVILSDQKDLLASQKRGEFKTAKYFDNRLASAGVDIPLKIFDISTKKQIFNADPPEKDWLGIRPDVFVSGLDFIGQFRVATCSKSDSVIRVYDTRTKASPIISVNVDQVAFNEHADAARFVCLASTGETGHSIVVGSNVGQILAIDLRFNVKPQPKKKKLKPRTYKVLGGFKGARGGSIKDVKIVNGSNFSTSSNSDGDNSASETRGNKVISCCLDRYLRIHNFTTKSRHLDKHVFMTTKPICCSPAYFQDF